MKRETKGALLLLLADALTLFLLLWGGLAGVLPVCRVQADPGSLLLWCALLSAASAALYAWRRGGWTALALLAAEALLVWRSWEYLAFGIWLEGGHLKGGAEIFLLAAAASLALGWAVVRSRCWYLAALAVLTPLLPAILSGILPNWTALTASTAGWGTMLLSALYSRRDKAKLARGTLLSLGGITALLLTLNAALPMEGYDRPQWATDARDGLVMALSDALSGDWSADLEMPELLEDYLDLETAGGGASGSGSGGQANFSVGDDGTVDLRSAGPRRYSGRVVMEVTGGRSGGFGGFDDLRGGTAAVYTGESWEGPAREFEGGADLLNRLVAMTVPEQPESVMTIRCLYPDTTAYLPYLTTGFSDGVTVRTDGSAVKRRGLREYEASYIPRWGPIVPLEGEAAELEARYREYVYDNYLAVPQEAREALEPLAEQFFPSYMITGWADAGVPEQWQTAEFQAEQAAELLSRLAVYDLNTPAMEPGEDFVTHFLEEGRGYCVHFATAGALLLRMKGIPARYVSGYVFEVDENGNGTVRDSNAHAWVEMYLDGRGWTPVEMTPGDVYLSDEAAAAGFQPAPAEDPEVPEEPEEDSDISVAPETPEEPEAPEEPETPAEAPEGLEMPEPSGPDAAGPGEAPEEREPVDLSWLWTLVKAAALLAVPIGLYRLGMELRRRERTLPDANRSVIRAYLRCRRLASWGAGAAPELEALAQKAKFSQHTLTDQERETAWALAEEAGARLEGRLPRWKRIVFRCLRPVWF